MDVKSRDVVINMLKQGACNISFNKVNGERRDMRCTLKSDLLPERIVEQAAKDSRHNDEVVSVFDMNKNDWRSFRMDNLITISLEA